MKRLVIYSALLVFFADMLRRAFVVHADSLLLPIAGVVFLLFVGVVRSWRQTLRRLTRRKRIDFIRPRTPQRRHPAPDGLPKSGTYNRVGRASR